MRDIADPSIPAYTVTARILHFPDSPRNRPGNQRRVVLLMGAARRRPRRGGETSILRLSSR
jgi:hypothetical protein